MTHHDTDTLTTTNQATKAATKPIAGATLAELLPQVPEIPIEPQHNPAPTTRPTQGG
ncbi:MAG: hypothetical protein GFH27_549297n45 [Chloroflexi bacterium AL-W]|nr:hypothetical protein [Chloroflexi bacterium AL-N1]NOK68569.1 hypothetical protein [Chloroflexi bacterium AL-N10]NOK76055.1 hypothetical protein [Chloroflexi bacterium AL-N5]NOK82528.1 hypothetical protein [Chloroflexi bacterium AL-W]NOK92838.1 hypothetical protein [Chloroflexi bacterium AL-N15]